MAAHHVPESACPTCGHKMDGAMNTQGDAAPDPGDVSVCIRCGEFLQFDNALKLEVLPSLDGLAMETVDRLYRARRLINAMPRNK